MEIILKEDIIGLGLRTISLMLKPAMAVTT